MRASVLESLWAVPATITHRVRIMVMETTTDTVTITTTGITATGTADVNRLCPSPGNSPGE